MVSKNVDTDTYTTLVLHTCLVAVIKGITPSILQSIIGTVKWLTMDKVRCSKEEEEEKDHHDFSDPKRKWKCDGGNIPPQLA